MRVLDLFSGIGGFSLGLERAGMETVAMCEIDPFCRKVLNKHWPDVPIFTNIRSLMADNNGNLWDNNPIGETAMSAKRLDKYADAPEMYASGMSIADCGEYYGITRQAMHEILKRRDTVFRSNKKFGTQNHFHRGGQTMDKRAQHMVEKAIKKGVLTPEPCEVCNAEGTFRDGRTAIQAHHDDYSKPLDVRWLCQPHHHEWHKTNKAKGVEGIPAADGIDLICGGYP